MNYEIVLNDILHSKGLETYDNLTGLGKFLFILNSRESLTGLEVSELNNVLLLKNDEDLSLRLNTTKYLLELVLEKDIVVGTIHSRLLLVNSIFLLFEDYITLYGLVKEIRDILYTPSINIQVFNNEILSLLSIMDSLLITILDSYLLIIKNPEYDEVMARFLTNNENLLFLRLSLTDLVTNNKINLTSMFEMINALTQLLKYLYSIVYNNDDLNGIKLKLRDVLESTKYLEVINLVAEAYLLKLVLSNESSLDTTSKDALNNLSNTLQLLKDNKDGLINDNQLNFELNNMINKSNQSLYDDILYNSADNANESLASTYLNHNSEVLQSSDLYNINIQDSFVAKNTYQLINDMDNLKNTQSRLVASVNLAKKLSTISLILSTIALISSRYTMFKNSIAFLINLLKSIKIFELLKMLINTIKSILSFLCSLIRALLNLDFKKVLTTLLEGLQYIVGGFLKLLSKLWKFITSLMCIFDSHDKILPTRRDSVVNAKSYEEEVSSIISSTRKYSNHLVPANSDNMINTVNTSLKNTVNSDSGSTTANNIFNKFNVPKQVTDPLGIHSTDLLGNSITNQQYENQTTLEKANSMKSLFESLHSSSKTNYLSGMPSSVSNKVPTVMSSIVSNTGSSVDLANTISDISNKNSSSSICNLSLKLPNFNFFNFKMPNISLSGLLPCKE